MSGDLQANGGVVLQCVAKALAAPLSPKTKIIFSQRGLQFAEDFGTTVQRSELIQTILGSFSTNDKTCLLCSITNVILLIGLLKCFLHFWGVYYQCVEHV